MAQHGKAGMTDDKEVRFQVEPHYETSDVYEVVLWRQTGILLETSHKFLKSEMVFSIMLSRIAKDMRRAFGPGIAEKIMRGFADTMDAAGKGDNEQRNESSRGSGGSSGQG
jgi:hypothetical protein